MPSNPPIKIICNYTIESPKLHYCIYVKKNTKRKYTNMLYLDKDKDNI